MVRDPIFMRTFIAVELEDEIKRNITSFSEEISDPACKKVKPENFHITLKFLGDVDKQRIEKLKEELKAVEHEPFEMEVKGTGVFPNIYYIKVLWVGAEGKFDPMVSQINTVTHDIKKRDNEFHPHITVARVKSKPRENLKEVINENKNKGFGSQRVEKFVLMKSELEPEGPVYENVKFFEI